MSGQAASGFSHDDETGIIENIDFIPSPNYDRRPEGTALTAIIIHAISLPPGCYGNFYVEDLFTNKLDPAAHAYFREIAGQRVSSHFYIKRHGGLVQFVSTRHRAWHAGQSSLKGRPRVNDFSIGIELEGCDEDRFERIQYRQLAALTNCLLKAHPGISGSDIVGHSDVSPGRKTDPGPNFDWRRYRSLITRDISP